MFLSSPMFLLWVTSLGQVHERAWYWEQMVGVEINRVWSLLAARFPGWSRLGFIQLTYFPWSNNIGHTDFRNKCTCRKEEHSVNRQNAQWSCFCNILILLAIKVIELYFCRLQHHLIFCRFNSVAVSLPTPMLTDSFSRTWEGQEVCIAMLWL